MNTMTRLWLPLVFVSFLLPVTAGAAPRWEAEIPPAAELDPVRLNSAFGVERIPNRDIVERLKGAYEIQPHSFDKLAPKTTYETPAAPRCRIFSEHALDGPCEIPGYWKPCYLKEPQAGLTTMKGRFFS